MEIFCEFYQISMITYNHMEEVLYHAIHISAFKIDGSSESNKYCTTFYG